MAECPLLGGCIFFNDKMASMPALSDMLKKRYCRKSYALCARYLVADTLGRDKVPENLTPNQTERADDLILKSNS